MSVEDEIAKLSSAINDLSATVQSTMGYTQRIDRGVSDVGQSVARTTDSLKKQQQAIDAVARADTRRAESLEAGTQVVNAFKTALSGSISVISSFATNLGQTRPTLTMFNNALSSVGDTAMNVGASLGFIGKAAGAMFKGYTEVLKIQLQIAQSYIDGRDSMIKLGGAGTITAESFEKMAKGANLNFATLERLVKPMESLGKNMMVLSNNMGDAQQKFAQLASTAADERARYLELGITQSDYIQSMADYIDLQSASGRMIKDQLADNTKTKAGMQAYLAATLELAAVTGQSADEQKKNQKDLLTQQNFQIRMMMMTAEANQLRTAGGAQNLARANQIESNKEGMKAIVQAAANTGNPELAKAMMNFVTRGYVDKEGAGLLMIPGVFEHIQAQVAQIGKIGQMSPKERQEFIAKESEKLGSTVSAGYTQILPSFGNAAMASSTFASQLFLNQAGREAYLRTGGATDLEKVGDVIGERIATVLKEGTPQGQTLAKMAETQLDLGNKIEAFVKEMPPIDQAMTRLTSALKDLTFALGALAAGKLMTYVAGGGARASLSSLFGGSGGAIAAEEELALAGGTITTATGAYRTASGTIVGRNGQVLTGAKLRSAQAEIQRQEATQAARVARPATKISRFRGPSTGGMIGGAAAMMAGAGIEQMGQDMGGPAGEFVSGAGDVIGAAGTGMSLGALFGPEGAAAGALIGAIVGLTSAITKNSSYTLSEAEATNIVEKDRKKRENAQKELDEKLHKILGDNIKGTDALKTKIGKLSDEDLKKLITSNDGLKTVTGEQKDELIKLNQAEKEKQQEEEELATRGFTTKDLKRLDVLNAQVKDVQSERAALQKQIPMMQTGKKEERALYNEAQARLKTLLSVEGILIAQREELKETKLKNLSGIQDLDAANRVLAYLDYLKGNRRNMSNLALGPNISSGQGYSQEQLAGMNINLAPGNRDIQAPGAPLWSKTIAGMQAATRDNIWQVTGANDMAHQRWFPMGGESHTAGKAFDISFPAMSIADPKFIQQKVDELRNLNYKVIDESTKEKAEAAGSKHWTAPHLHVEVVDKMDTTNAFLSQILESQRTSTVYLNNIKQKLNL